MKTGLVMIAFGMIAMANIAQAAEFSCDRCWVWTDQAGNEHKSEYKVYRNGYLYDTVERRTSGACRLAKNTDSRCERNDSWTFSCGDLTWWSSNPQGTCWYNLYYGGAFYERKTFPTRGQCEEAREEDSFCD